MTKHSINNVYKINTNWCQEEVWKLGVKSREFIPQVLIKGALYVKVNILYDGLIINQTMTFLGQFL